MSLLYALFDICYFLHRHGLFITKRKTFVVNFAATTHISIVNRQKIYIDILYCPNILLKSLRPFFVQTKTLPQIKH
jgi:hypothetical protein